MKANPWWYTADDSFWDENEFFKGLYEAWAGGDIIMMPESTHRHRAFIAEQLAGEQIEEEEAAYFRRKI